MRILIDADMLVYRAAFSVEERYYDVFHKEEGSPLVRVRTITEGNKFLEDQGFDKSNYIFQALSVTTENYETARDNFRTLLFSIRKRLLEHFSLHKRQYKGEYYLTSKRNFRKGVERDWTYKRSRVETPIPQWVEPLKEDVRNDWNGIEYEGLEADDLIAIEASEIGWNSDLANYIIVTTDKDLNQIPGLHFNPVTNKWFVIGEQEARKFFWKQMLMGDTADGIQGVPGIGDKKSDKILKAARTPSEHEQIVYNTYCSVFNKDEGSRKFRETYLLLRLCTSWEEADANISKYCTQ